MSLKNTFFNLSCAFDTSNFFKQDWICDGEERVLQYADGFKKFFNIYKNYSNYYNNIHIVDNTIKNISELDKRDMPKHTKTGIMNLLTSPTPFINQLFERDKIESILYSIVTNSIIKRKMPGDLMVLQSSTGLEIQAKALKQNDYDKNL